MTVGSQLMGLLPLPVSPANSQPAGASGPPEKASAGVWNRKWTGPGGPCFPSCLPEAELLTAQGVFWIRQNPGPKALRPMCILPEIESIWFSFIYT